MDLSAKTYLEKEAIGTKSASFIRVDEMVNFSLTGKSLSSLFIQLTFVPMLGPSPLVALEFFVFLPNVEQVSKKQTPLSQA